MPVVKVHVEQSLVSSIKADAPLGERFQCKVVLHIGTDDHESAIEAIGPADIWRSREVYLERQQLVGSSNGHNVTVDVDDFLELGETPELDFGKCRNQIGSFH